MARTPIRAWSITPIGRLACLFGDGGEAVLLEPAEEGEVGFIDFIHEIDGSGGVSVEPERRRKLESCYACETVDKKMH